MHDQLGVPMPSYVDLGRQLAQFDTDCSGGVDVEQFTCLFRHLLAEASKLGCNSGAQIDLDDLIMTASASANTINVGDEVWAPFLADDSGRKYRALVRGFDEWDIGRAVSLRWLRPPADANPDQYVCAAGFDDTCFTQVPLVA